MRLPPLLPGSRSIEGAASAAKSTGANPACRTGLAWGRKMGSAAVSCLTGASPPDFSAVRGIAPLFRVARREFRMALQQPCTERRVHLVQFAGEEVVGTGDEHERGLAAVRRRHSCNQRLDLLSPPELVASALDEYFRLGAGMQVGEIGAVGGQSQPR